MVSIAQLEEFISTRIEGKKPSVADLMLYRKSIGADWIQLRVNSPEAIPLLKDAIIFISDRPNYFFLRVSLSLKKKGIKTICLSRWGIEKQQALFFDHVVLFDKILDLRALRKCEACLLYVQSWIGWSFLPVYIKLITKNKVACNINDLICLLLDYPQNAVMLGLSQEEIAMDYSCERYIIEEFSFVTLPYDLTSLITINSKLHHRFNHQLFFFPCYPAPDFFSDINGYSNMEPINLIFIGGIPPDHKPDILFGDAKLHNIVDNLLKSGFKVTLFNNPQLTKGDKTLSSLYPHFTNLAAQNSYFEFREGKLPWELKQHIIDSHYGIMIYRFEDLIISQRHYQSIVPTKFFTYLELGLPVVVIDEMHAVSKIVREHNLGVNIAKDEINNLYNILEADREQYDQFTHNIGIFREQFNMDNKVDSIINFFRSE